MKTRIAIFLTVILMVLTGCGQQEDAAKEEAQAVTAPNVNLHMAALDGNIDAVRQHIEAGSDLNEKDMHGSTPLMTAATFDQTEVALALIEGGADLNLKNNEGSTALMAAAFFCRTEIVEALLAKGADKTLRNNMGASPLDAVSGPFEDVKSIYVNVEKALMPLGLKLDYEKIEQTRPIIAEMLQ